MQHATVLAGVWLVFPSAVYPETKFADFWPRAVLRGRSGTVRRPSENPGNVGLRRFATVVFSPSECSPSQLLPEPPNYDPIRPIQIRSSPCLNRTLILRASAMARSAQQRDLKQDVPAGNSCRGEAVALVRTTSDIFSGCCKPHTETRHSSID